MLFCRNSSYCVVLFTLVASSWALTKQLRSHRDSETRPDEAELENRQKLGKNRKSIFLIIIISDSVNYFICFLIDCQRFSTDLIECFAYHIFLQNSDLFVEMGNESKRIST